MSADPNYNFEFLKVTRPKEYVYHVQLNRPEKRNALTVKPFSEELTDCFARISTDPDCRAVVLSGAGKIFCAGLDLEALVGSANQTEITDPGRKAFAIRERVPRLQDGMSSVEKCLKPVIAAIHSGCVGGGVDLSTACDIRYCTKDVYFQIKEVDVGITADFGTLQRMPKVVGNESLVRELAFSGRRMAADEAKQMGLVSCIFPDVEALLAGAIETASVIASKSPIAVQGSKVNLIYTRDHSVEDGLNYVVTWNQAMLQSEDLLQAATALMTNEKPVFSKL